MRKISAICLSVAIGLCFVGCTGQQRFEISLQEGLFQGTSASDPGLTFSVEFSEMNHSEYVKKSKNKIKDLSTIDTKFYTAYNLNLVVSEGNENYVVVFAEAAAQNFRTTDTYRLKNITGDGFGRKLNLSDVELQLIDSDGDRTAEELKISYKLNGAEGSANLAFVSQAEQGPVAHHHFQYNCRLTSDENIQFEIKADDCFYAGTELTYYVVKNEGYKVIMYVNGEPYTEIDPSKTEVMRFGYVTGYRDVDIDFKSVQIA